MPETVSVEIQHSYAAPVERVFDAWLDPALIGGFLFGPHLRNEELLSADIDARVGSRFSFKVRRDGQVLDHKGKYFVIDRPHTLSFSWGVNEEDGVSRVTLTFTPTATGCDLHLTHLMAAKWADWKDKIAAGWRKIVSDLDTTLRQIA
ncbi:MAG TPA: SRPBCC family protein [Asticcacaulis sp.]|nr:SRPBCC family protein [Asticcacaulis sp.]